MVFHVGLNKAHELSDGAFVCGAAGLTAGIILSESESSLCVQHIGEGVDDRIDVAGLTPVFRVVVAVADAKGAHDCSKLATAHALTIFGEECLGEATTELTAVTGSLTGLPWAKVLIILLKGLAMEGEHLSERLTTTKASEVLKFDHRKKILAALFLHVTVTV